jgi:nitroreductase
METWQAICSRRNVRSFSDQPIDRKDLEQVLEAARRSPSSRNSQRWDFIVCTAPSQLERLATVWRGAGHVASSQATVAITTIDEPDPHARETIQFDLGQAAMAIALAAADLGIGSAHAAVSEHGLAREILALPEDHLCAWLLALGYPAERPLQPIARPDRRAFSDVVHWEHY